MTIYPTDDSQRKAAKVAGLAYLLSFATLLFGFFGMQSPLIVKGDVAVTIQNILAHERQLRAGLICELTYAVGTVVLLTALYTVLRPVNRSLALLAAFSRLVYCLMWALITLNMFAVVRLTTGAVYVGAFQPQGLQAMVKLFLVLGTDCYYIGLAFWGLAAAVCSFLWLKSRYIPRLLAAWGALASVWSVFCSAAFLFSPNFAKTVDPDWFDIPMALFEVTTSVWLLLMGLRPSRAGGTAGTGV